MASPRQHEDARADMKAALARHPVHEIEPQGSIYVFGRVHRDRIALSGYRMELGKRTRAALRHLRGERGAKRRFVILSRPRSGSTLLVDLLRQIEGLRCDGEMLHCAVNQPAQLLSALATTCIQDTYGCKVLSYQFFEIQRMRDPLGFFDRLAEDGFRFIHLRRDTFSQCLSLSTAQETKVYHSHGGQKQNGPVELELDEDAFRRQLEWNAAMLSYEDLLMSALPHERVQYETDLATPEAHQAAVDRICAFVGHPPGPVTARIRKIITASGGTRVTNRDALLTMADAVMSDQGRHSAP